ncbi:MAG: hypothetical protein K2H07_05405, partial [Lachnospiraceae bacterium]|nr:hypothetical protein [Lachnospiraceae bacterium]
VTYYITPYNGYTIKDVVVNGVSQGPRSSYTFTNIEADATITATFTPTGGGTTPPPITETPPTEAPPTEAPPTEAPPTEAPPAQ